MRNYFLVFVLLFGYSCENNTSEKGVIGLDNEVNVSVFDLVDSISVIQLETTNESLIKTAYVLSHKNRFYVFDGSQQIVFCFDNKGNYLFKINKKGRGPDEYGRASRFIIDPFNDYLMLLTPWGNLACYDLDGNFVAKIQFTSEARAYEEVCPMDKDKLLILTSNYKYKAGYYSRAAGQILKWCIPTTEEFSLAFSPGYSFYYNDSLYFYNNGIYSEVLNMTDSNQKIAYTYSFGKNNYTEKQINTLLEFMRKNREEKKSVITRKEILGNNNYPNYFVYKCLETKTFKILVTFYKTYGEHLYIFINKDNNDNIIFRKTKEGVFFNRYNIDRSNIVTQPDKDFPPLRDILNSEQLKIVDNHKQDIDNPLLVIYHLK